MPRAERSSNWTSRRLSAKPDSDVGMTVYELDSGVAGPNLLVLGGVHGDEVGGIVAAGRVATTDWSLVRGRLTVVPVTHETAHRADMRVSPVDGANLARTFPGAVDGTATEQLAWLITHELITTADVLIDLHTSNAAIDMPFFVGCVDDGSPQATRAVGLAGAFGISLLWTHPTTGTGRTLTVAHENGIPGLYVESPVGGVLNERYVNTYVDGVRSTMEQLGLLGRSRSRAADPGPELWLHGNGDTDTFHTARVDGLFNRNVALLDRVHQGDVVGRILDSLGTVVDEVTAPADGYITTLQRAAVVEHGQPIIAVTSPRPPKLGLPTDAIFPRTPQYRPADDSTGQD